MKTLKRFLRMALLSIMLMVLVVSATACGKKDNSIYVGNTASTTGAFQIIGEPFNVGIEAALAVYNKDGGYQNERKVKLKHYDDGGDAATSKSYTEKLIHDDGVFAIVGNFGSSQIAANLDVIKEAEIPMVYAAAGNSVLLNENATTLGERGIFPVQPLSATEGRMLYLRATAPFTFDPTTYALTGGLGGTSIAVITDSSEASQQMTDGIEAEAGTSANVNYQEVQGTDFAGVATTIVNAKNDLVIITVVGSQFTSALKALATAGFTGKVLTTYNNASAAVFNGTDLKMMDDYKSVFSTIAGGIYAQGWLDTSSLTYVYNEDTPLFNAYKTEYPGVYDSGVTLFSEAYWNVAEAIYDYATEAGRNDALSMSYNSYALAGYIAGDIFCQGLQALEDAEKELTAENYISIMESKELKVAMGDTISFANGVRAGVQKFSLTSIYNASATLGYDYAFASTVQPLTTLEAFRALIAG